MSENFQKIGQLIIDVLPELDGKVDVNHRLGADLGIDSLSLVEILFKVEKQFGIDIPDAQLERVETVQDILDLMDQK